MLELSVATDIFVTSESVKSGDGGGSLTNLTTGLTICDALDSQRCRNGKGEGGERVEGA